MPGVKQAWLGEAVTPDIDRVNTIDLRCAGFLPPITSIMDWLQESEVLAAGAARDQKGREIVRVHVRAKGPKNANDVVVDYVPELNYMPSRVTYRYTRTNALFAVTDIDYAKVGPKGGWFPKSIIFRSFLPHTIFDLDVPSGQHITERSAIKVVQAGGLIADSEFDPVIAPKTRLTGTLASQPRSGDSPSKVSTFLRKEPLEINPQEGQLQSHRFHWQYMLGLDGIAVGLCLAFRKRLVL
jgi:hypothetical protein